MLQEHDDRLRIIRARTILDMLGERPATGRDLFRPLKGLDNAALLVRGGRVLDVLPWKSVRVPVGTPVTDMGDVTLMPGSINAHCHLQLSHTAGRTLFGAGFTAWLRSLIALLREEHDGTALIGPAGTWPRRARPMWAIMPETACWRWMPPCGRKAWA